MDEEEKEESTEDERARKGHKGQEEGAAEVEEKKDGEG